MSRTKKLISFVLAAMLALGASGCGNKPTPSGSGAASTPAASGDKVQIKFLHKWPQPENAVYFDEVVAAYEAENPNVDIVVEAVADEPIKDKLRVLMGSNDRPDIFFSWSGEFANKFIEADAVYDLTPALEENNSEWGNTLMKAGTEPFSKDGKVYGIPLRINAKFFIYNQEIFDQYSLKAPGNWDEFLQVCETLKSNGVVPMSFGNQFPWAGCHYLTGLNNKLVSADMRAKDYSKATGEFTDPGYVQALTMFKEFNDKGYFNENPNSTSHDMAKESFNMGETAMIYLELEEFNTMNEGMEGTPWGFFPMPEITGAQGTPNYLTGAPDGFMVSSASKNPDIAIDFLKFMMNQENASRMIEMLTWPSPVIGATTAENSPEFLIAGMKAIEEADGMALWLDTDIHIKVADTYLPGMQEILNGTLTPEELMAKVQAVAKEVQTLQE